MLFVHFSRSVVQRVRDLFLIVSGLVIIFGLIFMPRTHQSSDSAELAGDVANADVAGGGGTDCGGSCMDCCSCECAADCSSGY